MTVDTRKLFKVRPVKKISVRDNYAKQIATNWLIARTTEEREQVRRLIGMIRVRENVAYIVARATVAIATTDFDKARWFSDFLK